METATKFAELGPNVVVSLIDSAGQPISPALITAAAGLAAFASRFAAKNLGDAWLASHLLDHVMDSINRNHPNIQHPDSFYLLRRHIWQRGLDWKFGGADVRRGRIISWGLNTGTKCTTARDFYGPIEAALFWERLRQLLTPSERRKIELRFWRGAPGVNIPWRRIRRAAAKLEVKHAS